MIGVKVDRAKRAFLDDGDISLEIGPFAISFFSLSLRGSGLALGLLLLLLAAALLAEDLECDADVATNQEEVLVQS